MQLVVITSRSWKKKSNPTMLTANLSTALPSNPFSLPRRIPSFRPTPFLVVSSAKKFRGRRRPPPRVDRSNTAAVEEEEEVGGSACLASPADVYSNGKTTKASMKDGGNEKEKEEGGGVLRGLDVLKAMQKAVSQKGKRRGVGRKSGGDRKRDVNAMDVDRVGGDAMDARPLEIREDWGPRLDALAKKIQELQEEQHD